MEQMKKFDRALKLVTWALLLAASWFFYGGAVAASGVGAQVGGLPKAPTFNSVTTGTVTTGTLTATSSTVGTESLTGDSNYVAPATSQYLKRTDTEGAIVVSGGDALGTGGAIVLRGNDRSSLPGTVDIYADGLFSTRYHASGAVSIGTNTEDELLNVDGAIVADGQKIPRFASVTFNSTGTIQREIGINNIVDLTGAGKWRVNIDSGIFAASPSCTCSGQSQACTITPETGTNLTWTIATGTVDEWVNFVCVGY